jgi:hypothetical protein
MLLLHDFNKMVHMQSKDFLTSLRKFNKFLMLITSRNILLTVGVKTNSHPINSNTLLHIMCERIREKRVFAMEDHLPSTKDGIVPHFITLIFGQLQKQWQQLWHKLTYS